MQYRMLGESDLSVSRMALGTMTFGREMSEQDAIQAVHTAIENGINFIDTANIYSKGESEIVVGKALSDCRDKVILATKCAGAMSDTPGDSGLARDVVKRHVDDSLKRMNVDTIDLLYLHFPDYSVSSDDLVETMTLLQSEGKIQHYGLSNYPAWLAAEIVGAAEKLDCPKPIASESVYNVLTRNLDGELLPFLLRNNIGLVTFNPLGGGLLTGKYLKGNSDGSRLEVDEGYRKRYLTDTNVAAMKKFAEIADGAGITMAELAFRWLFSKEYITSVICGFSSQKQLLQNIATCDAGPLSEDVVTACDDLWDEIKGHFFDYYATAPVTPKHKAQH